MLFVVPLYWRELRIGTALRFLLDKYWRGLSRMLRLSSYFYGVRYKEEEVEGPIERRLLAAHRRWTSLKRAVTRSRAPLPTYAGRQMRVPYADSVALVKPRRDVFVEVDHSGVPTTDEGKVTAVLQDRVGRKAHRRVKEDYTQVYMPGLYPLRFWIFGMSLWVSVAWTCVLALFIPIIIGRGMTELWFGYQVHDGYSFVSPGHVSVGRALRVFTCILFYPPPQFAGVTAVQSIVVNVRNLRQELGYDPKKRENLSVLERLRAETDTAESSSSVSQLSVRKVGKMIVRVIALFIVLPTIAGLLLELYVFFPLKYGFSDMTPVFYASEAW